MIGRNRSAENQCPFGPPGITEVLQPQLPHNLLIAANIENDLTLVDLAGIAGYSSFQFARKFTLAMSIPPHRYISRMRLENAMVELAAGKLPLAEIALNAHFSSQASFTRAFHRASGMTPKEYQRRRL